jgi:hypothetical protein
MKNEPNLVYNYITFDVLNVENNLRVRNDNLMYKTKKCMLQLTIIN